MTYYYLLGKKYGNRLEAPTVYAQGKTIYKNMVRIFSNSPNKTLKIVEAGSAKMAKSRYLLNSHIVAKK